MMSNFLKGIRCFFVGIYIVYIKHIKRLWYYYILPLIISFIIVFSVSFYLFSHIDDVINSFWSISSDRYFFQILKQILWYFLYILSLLITGILLIFIYIILLQIVFIPFKSELSIKVEEILTGIPSERFTLRGFFSELIFTIFQETKRIISYVIIMGIIFLLNLIPIIGNFLFAFLSWFFSTIYLCLEFIDQPCTTRRITLGQRLKIIKENLSIMLGFGTTIFFLISIPLVSFLVIPPSIAGGTYLFLLIKEPEKLLEQ